MLDILVKHSGSRRPASWKDMDGKEITKRSLSQAKEIVTGFRNRIVAGEDFAKIAEKESDCSSAKNGGDLGLFGRGQMQAAFENATYALKVGELSGLVESDSGVHIILRTL